MMRSGLLVLFFLQNPWAAAGMGPSFDCAKASETSERLICADEGLAALDRRCAGLYKELLGCLPAKERAALRADQRDWLAKRGACGEASCVAGSFKARIAELERRRCRGSVYRDEKLGFEIAVPKGMTASTDFIGHYFVSAKLWRQAFYQPRSEKGGDPGTQAVAIVAYRPNGDEAYPDVEVRVGVRKGATPEEACGWNPGELRVEKAPVAIDGRRFRVFDLSGGGMSQYIGGESYQTFERGACWAVERFVTGNNLGGEELDREEKRVQAAAPSYYDKTEAVVESFRLLP